MGNVRGSVTSRPRAGDNSTLLRLHLEQSWNGGLHEYYESQSKLRFSCKIWSFQLLWERKKKKRKKPQKLQFPSSSRVFINDPTSPHLGCAFEKARCSLKEKFLVGRGLEKGNQALCCSGHKAELLAASLSEDVRKGK